MKKVIGIIRNECGRIVNLVVFDLDKEEKEIFKPSLDAEIKFGNYPNYDENLDLIGNKGLIILEKTNFNVKVMTCSGNYIKQGDEKQIIAKTERLNMRIVNAVVLTNKEDVKSIYTL